MKRLGVEYVISESFDIYHAIPYLNALVVTNAAGALNPNIPVGTSA